jgi:hypothetical protein
VQEIRPGLIHVRPVLHISMRGERDQKAKEREKNKRRRKSEQLSERTRENEHVKRPGLGHADVAIFTSRDYVED